MERGDLIIVLRGAQDVKCSSTVEMATEGVRLNLGLACHMSLTVTGGVDVEVGARAME